jgi:hypothetical protein
MVVKKVRGAEGGGMNGAPLPTIKEKGIVI